MSRQEMVVHDVGNANRERCSVTRVERPLRLGFVIAASSLVADQVSKSIAHGFVRLHGSLDLLPGFTIVASTNRGVAFGLADQAGPLVLVVIGLGLTAALIAWLLKTQSLPQAIGLGLAIGGALGNVFDRVRLGAVRDFLDLYWGDHHWPTFNLADVAIVSGLALLVLKPDRAAPTRAEDDPSR